MFTLTEVASLNDIQPTYRILKPWWDVFMDYLGLVMLMLSIFAMTMQITKDQVSCLPCLEDPKDISGGQSKPFTTQAPQDAASTASSTSSAATVLVASPIVPKDLPDSALNEIHITHHQTAVGAEKYINQPPPTGVKTNLDYQQYIFINQMCYHVALPWYSKYFPYLTLIHTIVLMVSSNFWFKYPKTSSKIEHFVSILGRCFESPWTTKALSETACEDNEENKQRLTGTSSAQKQSSLVGKEDTTTTDSSTPMLGVK